MIAIAEHVWDSVDDARAFLSTGHAMLGGKRPIEVALTELGARRAGKSATAYGLRVFPRANNNPFRRSQDQP